MAEDVDLLIAEGNDAVRSGRWTQAREAFEGALAGGDPHPAALYGLGEALWWLGDVRDAIRTVERAYSEFRRREDHERAAIAAMQLCGAHRSNFANLAASAGWFARAERLVEQFDLQVLLGWLALTRAGDARDPADAERWARDALTIAREDRDLDLELCALSQIGFALVGQGRFADGLSMLDEAMAASLAGEGMRLDTVVLVSCQTLIACGRSADFERASHWVRAADDFVSRYGCPFLHATCRTQYGEVLFQVGRWEQAEQELNAAVSASRTSLRAVHGEALAQLAQLSLARGELERAEQLVAGFEDHAAALPVCVAIRLRRGEAAVAAGLVHRRLDEIGACSVEASRLLELLVEAQVALGEHGAAVTTAARLASLAVALACDQVTARSDRAIGRAALAAGDPDTARRRLAASLVAFTRLELPLEAARTRVLLARALAVAAKELAVAEAQAALKAFDDLGASGDADAVAGLLRGLGVRSARRAPRGLGGLTRREQEVLALLGEGMSNPAIAERLVISRKTAEHHVAHVLAKLGLKSRSEAAAYAMREVPKNR